jgi:ABC-type transporter lipoprotein component MlaA
MNRIDERRRTMRSCVTVLLSALVAGCAMGPSREDPFEPSNRVMYQVSDAIDTAVVKPVAQAYVDIVPQPIRTGVSNVFINIDDLVSAVNDLLQGKLDKFGDDFGRVVLNTGFGLGGIFDLASMIGIERGNEDFGQTFGVWGFRKVRTSMCRCSGPRRCATARVPSYASPSAARSATSRTWPCATACTAWAPSTCAHRRWKRVR